MSDNTCMVVLHLDGGVFLSLVTTNAWKLTMSSSSTDSFWPICWFFYSGMLCFVVTTLWHYTYGLRRIKSVKWSYDCFFWGGERRRIASGCGSLRGYYLKNRVKVWQNWFICPSSLVSHPPTFKQISMSSTDKISF